MNRKYAFALSLLLLSGTAAADEKIIDPEIEQAIQKSNAQMVKSVEQMNAAFEKVMPELTQNMAQTMSQLLQSITPLMQAMEKNQTFSKASEQISKDIAESVNELHLPNTKVEEGEFLNVKGSKTVNNNSVQFDVNQNQDLINNTAEFIRMIKAGEKLPALSLVALNDCIMKLKDFKLLEVDGNSYLVFDGKDKDHDFTYITGNIAPGLNLQVQTGGPDHEKAARDFIKSLRSRQIAGLPVLPAQK